MFLSIMPIYSRHEGLLRLESSRFLLRYDSSFICTCPSCRFTRGMRDFSKSNHLSFYRDMIRVSYVCCRGILSFSMLFESAFIDKQMSLKIIRLHIILMKVFSIPWSRQLLSSGVFKVVCSFRIAFADSERPFPNRPQFPLCWIFGCQCHPSKHPIVGSERSGLDCFVVVHGCLFFISERFDSCSFSPFVQQIQVEF
jgi:hypothetical protein